MEQNSIILVNKYSLSRLSTGFSVFSFFLMLKKVTSRETKFWLMYSIEYSTRNQQQNTEWWHIEWTSRVVNYNETIERERESSYNTIIFFFSLFIFNFFPFFCCCFFLLSLIVELLLLITCSFTPFPIDTFGQLCLDRHNRIYGGRWSEFQWYRPWWPRKIRTTVIDQWPSPHTSNLHESAMNSEEIKNLINNL